MSVVDELVPDREEQEYRTFWYLDSNGYYKESSPSLWRGGYKTIYCKDEETGEDFTLDVELNMGSGAIAAPFLWLKLYRIVPKTYEERGPVDLDTGIALTDPRGYIEVDINKNKEAEWLEFESQNNEYGTRYYDLWHLHRFRRLPNYRAAELCQNIYEKPDPDNPGQMLPMDDPRVPSQVPGEGSRRLWFFGNPDQDPVQSSITADSNGLPIYNGPVGRSDSFWNAGYPTENDWYWGHAYEDAKNYYAGGPGTVQWKDDVLDIEFTLSELKYSMELADVDTETIPKDGNDNFILEVIQDGVRREILLVVYMHEATGRVRYKYDSSIAHNGYATEAERLELGRSEDPATREAREVALASMIPPDLHDYGYRQIYGTFPKYPPLENGDPNPLNSESTIPPELQDGNSVCNCQIKLGDPNYKNSGNSEWGILVHDKSKEKYVQKRIDCKRDLWEKVV